MAAWPPQHRMLFMQTRDYERVANAIRYIEARYPEEPALEQIAGEVGLSPYHFERLFKRWAGTTPKRFVQCLRLDAAKTALENSQSLLEASWEAGLSSPSRLHDLFSSIEAVTPGQYKSEGLGLEIRYGVHATPFGDCLIALTKRGICRLAFFEGGSGEEVAAFERDWPQASIEEDSVATRPLVEAIFSNDAASRPEPFHLFVRGTNFQVQVWRALVAIPPAHTLAYRDIAALLGRPNATRAVANAIAANPIAYLIPCHRVLRANGALSGYRWGRERKRALLAWESARVS